MTGRVSPAMQLAESKPYGPESVSDILIKKDILCGISGIPFPFGCTKLSYPNTFHVKGGSGIDNKLSFIALDNGSITVAKENGGWSVH